ncbi:MAG: methyltransferase domain-containing protein [Rhodospirillaceae bacterium]|nr:methyltransferase domain-containing protein [Rhodospirillaceae bacterium]
MSTKSTSGTWNPDLYLRYAAYRARPAEDLMPRLKLNVPGDIYDLGCGPGNLTQKLKDTWPDRNVIGVDSSPDMLKTAREKIPNGITWQQGDISAWGATSTAALVFTNAALHWVPDHKTLLPRLMRQVAPGGLLAMQVPVSHPEGYHQCIEELAKSPKWHDRFKDVHAHDDPLAASAYYDLLSPLCSDMDIWETDYHHVLEGENPVTEWISSTGLVPFLTALPEADRPAYLADYSALAAKAYPRQADGKVLFTMHRLFVLATRKG